jgi:PAS domain S-box-containing protein
VILNVSRDENARAERSRVLALAGYEVRDAPPGPEALCLVAEIRVHLVLLEIRDPEAIAFWHSTQAARADCPMLVTIGGAPPPEIRPDACLTTLVPPDALVAAVGALLRARSAEMELASALEREREARKRLANEHAELRDAEKRHRKLAEAAELDRRELASVINSMNEGVAVFGRRGEVLMMNPAALRLHGFRNASEMSARVQDVLDLFEARSLDGSLVPVEQRPTLRALAGEVVTGFEEQIRRRDTGQWFIAEYSAAPVRNAAGEVERAVVTIRDITKLKEAEQALRQAQKRESIGVLAGGVAHDFNNLLTAILGNASLAQLEAPESMRGRFDAILEASEKAAALTRQLLAYAGKGQFQIGDFDLSNLIRSSADLIRVSIPKSIELVLDVARDLPAVRGDSTQIHQVIMNLVINAAEAIGEGRTGRVSVAVDVKENSPDAPLPAPGLAPGRYVCITVQDDGCGMDDEVKARMFDPFFSTKFTGRGLGLAAVHGILRSHKGGIAAESVPGEGTTFTVYLPCCASPAAAAAAKEIQTTGRVPCTVLVVDDEEQIRSFTRAALERLGHRVVMAENGRQALELLDAGLSVDLVLLDIIMPVLGGADAFVEIRKKRPGLPVLVATGYSREEAQRAGIPGNSPVIEKPYTVQKLAAAVGKALGTGPWARS